MHRFAVAAGGVAKPRLGNVFGGYAHVAALGHVGDGTLADHALHRLAQLRFVTPQKAFAVGGAFVAAVQSPVDKVDHVSLFMALRSPVSLRRLPDAQIPLGQQAHLLFGVALLHHARDKILVLVDVLGRGLGVKRNHRQQIFGIGEHFFLDHLAQLFIAAPGWILAAVVGARAQHEIDDFVAVVFGIGDARGLLDFFQLGIKRSAVKALAGFRVAEVLVLDPAVGIRHVAVENILPVLGV